MVPLTGVSRAHKSSESSTVGNERAAKGEPDSSMPMGMGDRVGVL